LFDLRNASTTFSLVVAFSFFVYSCGSDLIPHIFCQFIQVQTAQNNHKMLLHPYLPGTPAPIEISARVTSLTQEGERSHLIKLISRNAHLILGFARTIFISLRNCFHALICLRTDFGFL
jgi:hypothetical protein